MEKMRALVVFSGGQDSTTCLGWAKREFDEVLAITFSYGQRHEIEIAQAKKIAQILKIPHALYPVEIIQLLGNSALVEKESDLTQAPHTTKSHLPASFVPNRNALFFTLAHAYAQKEACTHIVVGISEADYSGYPDCREGFIKSLETTLNLGSDSAITFLYPLLHKNKAETFALAETCGVLELVLEDSHTCYEGERGRRHAWGYGCGICPACLLRAKGWGDYEATKTLL